MTHSFCGWRSGSTVSSSASVGEAAQHQIELPGDVGRVPQPRAQALPEERRRQVRGVADQQRAAVAHPLGEHRAELVDGVARQRSVGGVNHGLEQLPGARGILEVGGDLAGEQHELEAAMAGAAVNVGRGAHRVAPLAGRGQVERVHVVRLRSTTSQRS